MASSAPSAEVGEPPSLQEVMDDLAFRFVVNCPAEEQASFERLLFQVEAAYWFYEDQYREIWPEVFPTYTLLTFAQQMFKHCELLAPYESQTKEIYTTFTQYKYKIPTAGALLLNASCTKVLLVRSWYGKLWGFPKGKIDCDEDMPSCARREVLEEVGYDISDKIDPDAYVELQLKQYPTLRLYIIRGVDEGFDFVTQTKKEISAIEWYKIKDIPLGKDAAQDGSRKKGFGMVAPYIIKLKQWLSEHKKAATEAKKDGKRSAADSEVEKTAAAKAVAVTAPAGTPARRKAAQATGRESQVRVLQAQPRKERKGHPFLDFTFTTRRVLSALDVSA